MSMALWRTIPNENSNYLASSDGQIKNVVRGKLLKQWLRGEYLTIEINSQSRSVHRLICAAFHEKPDGKDYVNHKDGDKLNNNEWNVEWCTKSENAKHMYATGLRKTLRNEDNPSTLYSNETVNKVKGLLSQQIKQRDIAKACGVSQSLVSCINRGLLRCYPTSESQI